MLPSKIETLLRDGTRQANRLGRDGLKAPVVWLEEHLPARDRALAESRSSSPLWPTFLAAAGAGVAFWWWTQWARGRAEAAERAEMDAAGGAEGRAYPEQVMAHRPEPEEAPVEAPDTSADKLQVPAEDVMAHVPPPEEVDPAKATASSPKSAKVKAAPKTKATSDEAKLLASTAPAGLAAGVAEVVPPEAAKSLEETLGVQASDKKPKSSRKGGSGEARA